MSTGFQLSVELSKVFPIATAVQSAGAMVLDLARNLRRSGSDLVVEEDLASVFGRAKIVSEVESTFKKTVSIQTFTPLNYGFDVRLDSGSGPTMHHAMTNGRYFAMAIQLSWLSWIIERRELATMIDNSLRRRFEMKLPDTCPGPGYGGVEATLAAISTQTSAFMWSHYAQEVEARLRTSIPGFQYSALYLKICPNMLLGAMDYLVLVQSLPDDRRISISNEIGCIALTVWANCILGLTVAITNTVAGPIIFGDAKQPQMFIKWSNISIGGNTYGGAWPTDTTDVTGSQICLLDRNMEVILEQNDEETYRSIISIQERHPLLGYGTLYLRRAFNTNQITDDNSPLYEESVKLITALSINASQRLNRKMGGVPDELRTSPLLRNHITLEMWRIMDATKIIFGGIKFDAQAINNYLSLVKGAPFDENLLPACFMSFLSHPIDSSISSNGLPAQKVLSWTQHLAEIVLTFGHVEDVR